MSAVDAYHGLFNQPGAKKNSIDQAEMPMVHVHCFSKADDPAAEVLHVSFPFGIHLLCLFILTDLSGVLPTNPGSFFLLS